MSEQQPKYHSTGRGGAGNIVAGDAPEPRSQKSLEEEIPKLDEGGYYTTGRGGLGNMRQNVDSQVARKAQDIDTGLQPMASNGSVGRGGYGNLRRQHSNTPEGRRQSATPEGRRQSTADQERPKHKSLVERAREFFTG
ncbi:hypothetical protein TRVA0_001S06106 [Trichomonascus vanleenenianus]|uniref:uncharacterized protein n=1 Tax=Trichomonascus vanleenenianus TaxID=2268995 RepID=UPI003ECB788E